MRTTVRLDDELLAQVKMLAVQQRRTLTSVIEEALRRLLQQSGDAPAQGVELSVSQQPGWTHPGVDVDDSAALLEALEPAAEWAQRHATP